MVYLHKLEEMENKRQKQVAELIKRNFGIVLQQEGSYIYGNEAFVTTTSVKISPDFGIAKIYLSVYNIDDKQNVILSMEAEKNVLKNALAQRIRKHVRKIPDVIFFLDDTLDEMLKLNQLFDNINTDDKDKPS